MKRSVLVLSVLVLFLTSCLPTRLLVPVQSDVDRIQDTYPGFTLAELEIGKSLYEYNCGMCHRLKKPESQTREAWARIVPGMSKKANKKKPGSIDAEKQELILKYLITMSGK